MKPAGAARDDGHAAEARRLKCELQRVTDALVVAIWRRVKSDALLHHSDKGSQYASERFQKPMADNGGVCSMSRSSNVWENAAMERFFPSLKSERIRGRGDSSLIVECGLGSFGVYWHLP